MRINQILILENDPCWDGYKRVPGTKKYEPGSCERVEEDWNKVNKKDKTSGMSRKAVKAYRRENPGSKLQTAVTTKPSKLKKGSKAAKRRKSFCARMSGNKGPMKKPNGKPTPKALALRRWNCESVEELENLVMIAEQKINEAKNLKQQAAIAISKKKKQGVAEDTPDQKSLRMQYPNYYQTRDSGTIFRTQNDAGQRMDITPDDEEWDDYYKRQFPDMPTPNDQGGFWNDDNTAALVEKTTGVGEGIDQWYTVMRGNLDFQKRYHGKGDDVTGPLAKVQANAELNKTHPHDSNWTMVPASAMQKQMHETKSSPQAILARKALDRGSKKMPGMSNIVQQLVHEIKPDGTVVVKNSSDTRTMNNIKKILELGGGKNFDVVMAPPGPGWQAAKPVPVPDQPGDKKEVAEVKDDEEDDGLIGGIYTPEQWAKMIANLKRKAQDQDAKKKQQEKPKDLSESTDELNKLITLSGHKK